MEDIKEVAAFQIADEPFGYYVVKLWKEDKDQLDRIEAMLTELTGLPHNKRPTEREVYLNDQISQDNEAMLRAHGWVKND